MATIRTSVLREPGRLSGAAFPIAAAPGVGELLFRTDLGGKIPLNLPRATCKADAARLDHAMCHFRIHGSAQDGGPELAPLGSRLTALDGSGF